MSRPLIHPGEILADELVELGITPTELSRQIGVPPNRISQSIQGTRAITGDTAKMSGQVVLNRSQFGVGQGQFAAADTVPFEVTVPITVVAKRAS